MLQNKSFASSLCQLWLFWSHTFSALSAHFFEQALHNCRKPHEVKMLEFHKSNFARTHCQPPRKTVCTKHCACIVVTVFVIWSVAANVVWCQTRCSQSNHPRQQKCTQQSVFKTQKLEWQWQWNFEAFCCLQVFTQAASKIDQWLTSFWASCDTKWNIQNDAVLCFPCKYKTKQSKWYLRSTNFCAWMHSHKSAKCGAMNFRFENSKFWLMNFPVFKNYAQWSAMENGKFCFSN